MFKGEDSVTFETKLPFEKVSEEVEDALRELGRVEIAKKGGITIEPKGKYKAMFAEAAMEGTLEQSKKNPSQYTLTIAYDANPTIACWIIAILTGATLCFGFLLFLIPYKMKGQLGKDVLKTLRVAEDAVTESSGGA